ncbi:atpE [Symbiodinium pilosum]|uniref:AtpE protein n=1 Tax=Symbiodinium pilosum TaxID=2952 RepID=A0A812N7B7_SYMPI|nr:atpE [Symbiodinium pilosum]
MAFFSLSMVLSLAALTAAETSFSTSHAQLEAKMILYTNSSWHLGGFCLDQAGEGTTKAAEIHARVEWEGTKSLGETGPVMLVAFDAREERWGAVKDSWGQMPCEEKLQAATMSRQLGGAHSYDDFFFRINVHQSSAMRDWHFAVLTCGATERAQFSLTLQATHGALSIFGANTHFQTSSCPAVQSMNWLEAAHDEVGFWLLLVVVLLFGCSSVLAIVACRHFRKKAQMQRFENTAVAGGAEPVIGRPCSQLGEAKVVDGQITREVATAGNGASAPDSCV